MKMNKSFRECFYRYISLEGKESNKSIEIIFCGFKNACAGLKKYVDRVNISEEWVKYLSPTSEQMSRNRSSMENTPLDDLYIELPSYALSSNERNLLSCLDCEIRHEVTYYQ